MNALGLLSSRRVCSIRTASALPLCPTRTTALKVGLQTKSMPELTLQSTVKLASGYEMPRLGFGVYQTPAEEAGRCVRDALEAGYRHVDSAVAYRNQAACGAAIRAVVSEKGMARERVFFTSKVRPKEMSYEAARAQVESTLAETGLGYIDLMLVHAPYGGSAARKGVWRALVESVEEGRVRSIGVSNYGVAHLEELERHIGELEAERGGEGKGGVVSVGQWEIHPWLPRRDIVAWARRHGVAVQAYSPLARGTRFGEEDSLLSEVAARCGRGEVQVLVRWSLQMGFVPLPKSTRRERIVGNCDVFGWEIGEADMTRLELDSYAPSTWDPTTSPLDR